MVAVLVRLKLSLLRNSLRQSPWRIVGLVFGVLWGLGMLALGVAGLGAARLLPVDQAGAVVILGGSVLVVGWLILPLLLFGADETLDPGRFALLPLSARELLPGLLAAGAIGVPGIVTSVVALATVATWSRGPLTAIVALLAALLGILICLLSARALTSALSGMLASRRFQDLASLLLVLALMGFAVGVNSFNALFAGSPDQMGRQLLRASEVLAWTPLGWPWSAPVDAALSHPFIAVVKLLLSAGLALALAACWHHFLSLRLTSAIAAGNTTTKGRSERSVLERVLPADATGATALRGLRYLRRDPRYLASAAGVIIAPVIIVVANGATGGIGDWFVWLPVLVAGVVGISACQDISYDGSAFWTQVSSGVAGRSDLAGRALAVLVWSGPLVLIAAVAAGMLTGRWDLMPAVLGLSGATALCGIGVAMGVTARWQGPVAPPGANPFASGSGGSIESFVAVILTAVISGALILPILALVIGSIWLPVLAWVALALGPLWGVLVLRVSLRVGGAYLDAHWPEVLARLSKHA